MGRLPSQPSLSQRKCSCPHSLVLKRLHFGHAALVTLGAAETGRQEGLDQLPGERGLALCGSGVGASIASNKVPGVRAGLIHDVFYAHQGVEDDDMNVSCLGGKVIGSALAWELVETFLAARFSGAERHLRRIAKVQALESRGVGR